MFLCILSLMYIFLHSKVRSTANCLYFLSEMGLSPGRGIYSLFSLSEPQFPAVVEVASLVQVSGLLHLQGLTPFLAFSWSPALVTLGVRGIIPDCGLSGSLLAFPVSGDSGASRIVT